MATQAIMNFLTPVYNRSIELLTAPAHNFEMIWLVAPLILVTLLMTFYFGRYSYEDMGWNTAVGNSLVLMFVSIDLLRHIYNLSSPGSIVNYFINLTQTIVILAVAAEGILLLYSNFLHFLPKRLAFFISAPLPVNLTAYTVMAIVYTGVPVEWTTLWAAIGIFFVLLLIILLLKKLVHLQTKRSQDIRQEEMKEAKIRKKVEESLEKPKKKSKKSTTKKKKR